MHIIEKIKTSLEPLIKKIKPFLEPLIGNKKKLLTFYYIVLILSLIIGIKVGTHTNHYKASRVLIPESPVFGRRIPEYEVKYFGWFDVVFSKDGYGWDFSRSEPTWSKKDETFPGNIALVVIIYCILIIAPFPAEKALKLIKAGNIVKKPEKKTPVFEQDFEEIKKYKKLLDLGAITQEEFDIKKKEILKCS